MKRIFAIAVTAVGLSLSACGGATVDSSDVSTSAPAPTSTSAPTTQSSATESTKAPSSRSSASEDAGADQPAREVESAPEPGVKYSANEEAFLAELSNQGISVQGVEDQLTGTGFSICDGNTITRDAVAGQLIEQGRTELDVQAIATLIDDNAHEHLC